MKNIFNANVIMTNRELFTKKEIDQITEDYNLTTTQTMILKDHIGHEEIYENIAMVLLKEDSGISLGLLVEDSVGNDVISFTDVVVNPKLN